MRISIVFGLVVVAVGLGWSAGAQPHIVGEATTAHTNWSGLITHFSTQEGGATTVTVIDPQKRVMTVYHVGGDSGQIQLKSVRPLQWDMEMNGYNTGKPLPSEVRAGLERRP